MSQSVDRVRSLQGSRLNHPQLEFQDSSLSPGLVLLPANPLAEANVTEYSFFQKSDMEFHPLRGCPDLSMASERTGTPPAGGATHESDEASLSQHLLAQETMVPESGSSGCCSPSQLTSTSEDGTTEEKRGKVNAAKGRRLATPAPSPRPGIDASAVIRQRPPGKAAEVSNVTSGSRSTCPDATSELLYRELMSQSDPSSTPLEPQLVTSYRPDSSDSGTSVTRSDQECGPVSTNMEPSLWGSGNPTGMEESYRGFMPQSQSTPGGVKVPPKSSVKPKSRRLSAIWSNDGSSSQPTSPPPTATEHQDQTTASRVRSLPTLNYMQKVDAWRESQSSSKTPLFDTMALQGSAGAESGSLDRILSDRAKGPAATESCSAAPSRGVSMVGNKAATSSSLSAVVMTRPHHSSPPIDAGRLSNTAPLESHLLAGAQGSKSSQVKLGASLGAASWSSKPKHAGLNIQHQIPASLYNLGIDQSASAIPTPFSHRGPIGEPEFSPADLSTVKDSVGGTPTESVRPEAGSSRKGESCDTLQPAATPRPGQNRNSDASSAARSQEDPSTSESSGVRARSSPFCATFPLSSEKRRNVCQPNGRAEPEGCSAAPPDSTAFPPPLTMDPQEPASLSENPTDTPDGEHSLVDGSELTDFSAPILEDRDPAVMSDVSSKSSLTARVAKLLQGESASDQKDPEHRKKFMLNVSGGQFESLDLDKEDRERIEELKAEMLSNHFLTSESSTDTESTAASGVAAQHLSDVKGAWAPVLPGPKRAELEARLQGIAAGGGVSLPRTNVQSHTSITISTRKREASPPPPPPPAPVHLAELPAGSATLSEEGSEMLESEDPPCSSKAQDGEEETTREESVTEDTTIPFSPQTSTRPGYISQVHLTISPKTSQPAPRASSSSSHTSAESAHGNFAPLRRSSPAVSSADEGVGLPGPPDTAAPPKDPSEPPQEETTAAGPHQSFTASHSNMTGRSFTPEMPVRDDCAPRAAPPVLQPYKPRGAAELFLIPQSEANSSTSCTTMESSHTGSDDAIPPLFSSEVLGHQDPGLDRGVTIKHAQGIYSKRPHTSTVRTREAAHRDKTPPQVSPAPREAPRMEPIQAGGKQHVDLHPQSHRSWPVTTEREAWLMEQLLHLSELIHNTRGVSEQPARTYYGREEPRVGGGKAAGKAPEGRTPPPPRQAWTHHPEELGHAPFTSTSRFCPADRDESTTSTSKSTSTSTSTVDTDRLIRVFGLHRVQPVKSQSGLQKLYSSISRQRDEWEGRSFSSQTETTSEESNVPAESSSSGSPVRTSKNNAKVVSRGVQAGDLEIVCNATRHHTRDVGTIFPSPRHPQRSQPASHKQKKSRAPPKPKAVSWFIPLDHVESQSRKENRPEEQQEEEEEEEEEDDILEPSSLWYDTYRRSVVWRQPLQPRQHHLTTEVTSLQEALVMYRPDFICRSRQRLHILTQHNQDRKAIGRPAGVLMRAVPWKEMIQRTKRMYDSLPEVQRKRAAERQKSQTQSNRLNVQLYNKKLTKRLLENRPAASHKNYW
ncbi:mucin-2 isoform X2 [Entelurus aequoreus]|uniref:mucin-2 isoform X2 n=1 Tax=Entelurus aequoreus TaxID=161455 RepID=UPI002B1D796F|nr:mucin-2 isoform X2 [Entelurus aequoreus]